MRQQHVNSPTRRRAGTVRRILRSLAINPRGRPHQRLAVVARGGGSVWPIGLAPPAPHTDRQARGAKDGPGLVHNRSRRPRLLGRRGRQITGPDEAGRPTWTPAGGVGELQSLAGLLFSAGTKEGGTHMWQWQEPEWFRGVSRAEWRDCLTTHELAVPPSSEDYRATQWHRYVTHQGSRTE